MRTLVLGFDAFDPIRFERLSEESALPNLSKYARAGGYARFFVVNSPQTEVSWTSIATGLDPGGHWVFDFVHRDPASYTPYMSVLTTSKGPFGTRFVPPCKARSIYEEATRQGYATTTLWWPATFPARPELPVRTMPGLGTPDIQGRWGVGTLYVSGSLVADGKAKTSVVQLGRLGVGQYKVMLRGPDRKRGQASQTSVAEAQLLAVDDQSARPRLDARSTDLIVGKWSPVLEIRFTMEPFLKFRALARVILTQVTPEVRLYVTPLQLHPLRSPWRYATPLSFARSIWKTFGPFLTLGWPQDTTGLEDGCITDQQFLDSCASVFETRERILMRELGTFDEGILASVFDSLDRVQHMFRRDRPDIADGWYARLDALVGRVESRLSELGETKVKIVIMSDHGFSEFAYKAHVDRCLVEHGFLVATRHEKAGGLDDVDWSRSFGYAVGLNSIYVNMAGREGNGSVRVEQVEPLTRRMRAELLAWKGPDGGPVVQSVFTQAEVFHGPFAGYGPDLIIGYSPRYRASAETGLGQSTPVALEPNHDNWGADHCIDPQSVPGVLFCNQSLAGFPAPSYRDIPLLTVGTTLSAGDSAPPLALAFGQEDKETLEERLNGLGYL